MDRANSCPGGFWGLGRAGAHHPLCLQATAAPEADRHRPTRFVQVLGDENYSCPVFGISESRWRWQSWLRKHQALASLTTPRDPARLQGLSLPSITVVLAVSALKGWLGAWVIYCRLLVLLDPPHWGRWAW